MTRYQAFDISIGDIITVGRTTTEVLGWAQNPILLTAKARKQVGSDPAPYFKIQTSSRGPRWISHIKASVDWS